MGMTKLTLSAERGVIKEAKRLATAHHTTVSAMFSRFLRALAREEDIAAAKLGPVTERASGLIKLPRKKTHKDLLGDALSEKYGLSG